MKKPTHILILFLALSYTSIASENFTAGARAVALSNATVSLSDVWSTFHNQATLAGMSKLSAGIYYESRFMLEELSLTAGTFSAPFGGGTAGISFYQFGKGSYKESKLGLAYARQLSRKLSAALQLDYFASRFPENEGAFTFLTFECGLVYQLTHELTLGAHVFNPVENGFETYSGKQEMPFTYRLGGHYLLSEYVLVCAEVQKSSGFPAQVKSGVEFMPVKNLALRLGVSGKPFNYSGGIGYSLGNISTDFAFSYHGNLGFTPSVSVQFHLR
ncbi:hypothetical protein [Maribellus sp. YY47]|uniref:hypothetical protein n=1 Tax=Maribellus sp. YY47 TaxID=2929486 RepID=UPI002000FF55|nr:hypothetical protein [Maribellus sp. YY47]MCK3682701.1 hypothetical protein [Maribellus sp. YY47]